MPGPESPDATDRHREGPEPRHGARPRGDLAARLDAVERALTDEETPVADLGDAAELTSRLDAVEETLEDVSERVEDLEAATQALRGFVGGVRAVDRDVERRADAALSRIDALERRLDRGETGDPGLRVERLAAVDDEHGADEYGADEHGADEHGADEHGVNEYSTDEHGAHEHSTDALATGGDPLEGRRDDDSNTGAEAPTEAGLESLASRLRDAL